MDLRFCKELINPYIFLRRLPTPSRNSLVTQIFFIVAKAGQFSTSISKPLGFLVSLDWKELEVPSVVLEFFGAVWRS